MPPTIRHLREPVLRTESDLSALEGLQPATADALEELLALVDLHLGLDLDPWPSDG